MTIKPIKNNLTCSQKMLGIMNNHHSLEDDAIYSFKNGFEDSADFKLIYRNVFNNNLLKTWITDGTTDDKTLGYKKLVSYPYKPISFKIGDYIYFDYYHVGDNNYENWSPWLLLSLDYQNYYNVTGRLFPCNENIKWVENNIVKSYPCYFEDSMKYTTLDFGQQGFTVAGSDITIYIQDNIDTKNIYINQRFLFRGRAYVVRQINPEINSNVIKIFLSFIQTQPNDDIENNIAWNGKEINDNNKNNNILSPNIDGINLNKTISFNIYSFIDNIKQNSEFNISVKNIPNTYYELVILDGNNFTIKNLQAYTKNTLLLECKNRDTNEIVSKEIWLKGVF